MSEPIDLNHAFPEFTAQMHSLRETDGHFRTMYEQYLTLEKTLHRVANEAETPADAQVEEYKKQRLELKDKMFAMLHAVAA